MVVLDAQSRQLLMESRRRALEVLSVSEQRAQDLLQEEERGAVAQLLKQRATASDLLAIQADNDHELVESNRLAAEVLADEQLLSASVRREHAEYRATDILLSGQREAAAILLEAHMKVAGAT